MKRFFFLIERMLTFAEENWSAFIAHCKEGGYSEDEIEGAFDAFKAEAYK